jgi:hypothetical protein
MVKLHRLYCSDFCYRTSCYLEADVVGCAFINLRCKEGGGEQGAESNI